MDSRKLKKILINTIVTILTVVVMAACEGPTDHHDEALSDPGVTESAGENDKADQTLQDKVPEGALTASTYEELESIFESAASGGQFVVCLTADIEQQSVKTDEILTIPYGADIRMTSATSDKGGSYAIRQIEMQTESHSAVLNVQGTLTLENITIDANNCGRCIYVERSGRLTLEEGALITGGTTTSKNVNSGLGVYVAGTEAAGDSYGVLVIEEGAEISGNTHASSKYGRALGIGVYAGGEVTMNGGTVSENTDLTDPSSSEPRAAGGAVYTKSNASSATSPWAQAGLANFTMNGGEIRNNTAFAGGGIYADDYSTVRLNAGVITENTAIYAGGALATDGNSGNTDNLARLSVQIGSSMIIDSNTAEAGGAIYAGSGHISIEGAEISNNTAKTEEDSPKPSTTICAFASSGGSGGAIFMAQAEVRLEDALLTGNLAYSSVQDAEFPVGNGGAVYVTNAANYIYPCKLTVVSGKICDNEASGSGEYAGLGGGICVGFEPGEEDSFIPEVDISGGVIKDNKAEQGEDIFICRELSYKTRGYGGSTYGIDTQSADPVIYLSDEADIGEILPEDYAFIVSEEPDSENTEGQDDISEPEAALYDQEEMDFLSAASSAFPKDAVIVTNQDELTQAVLEQAACVVLDSDISLVKPLTVSSDLAVYGRGHTISMETSVDENAVIRITGGEFLSDGLLIESGTKSRTLYIEENAKVLIRSSVLKGRMLTEKGISVYNAGTLTLQDTLIKNAASASTTYKGVIYNSGQLEFSGNSKVSTDSYVYTGTVYNDGTFTMNGGFLSGVGSNSNRKNCGAAVTNNGEFLMSDGVITQCVNSEAVLSSGTFIMTGGSICNNITTCMSGMTYNSVMSGGGVLIYGGTFDMYDGASICGNAGYMGAGVGVYYTGSVFNMYGGTISGNSARIDLEESSFNENNGCGGGVGVYGGAEFHMYGGTVCENVAYIGDMIDTSRMSGNHASLEGTGLGGGVYITEGSITISGGIITGNVARCAPYGDEGGLGGGIYIRDPGNGSAHVSITGGSVYGNTAEGSAGNDIYSGCVEALTADLICLEVGGNAQIGDICLSGNRLLLGICNTIENMNISSLRSEGRSSTGAAIAVYAEGTEASETDPEHLGFTGAADLILNEDRDQLVIGLIDLSRVTDISIEDVIFTGKPIETAALTAKMQIADSFELTAEGLAGLRAENIRNNIECGTATLDLRGDMIRYCGTIQDVTFRILPMPLDSEGLSVEFVKRDAVYIADGKTQFEPEIRLILDSRSNDESVEYLEEGFDYTVDYKNNQDAGSGIIEITATGLQGSNYTGSRTVTFEIYEKMLTESIALDQSEVYLPAGGEEKSRLQLSYSISPEGAMATSVIWESSDDKVCTVDETGLITALSCGDVTITARADDENGKSASCEIHVLYKDVAGSPISTAEDYQYYFEPVYWAVDAGIVEKGNDGGANSSADSDTCDSSADGIYFGVGERCSKGDYLIMLWKYAGSPENEKYKAPDMIFDDMSDCSKESDIYKAAAWGYSEKVIYGSNKDGQRLLYPDVPLSRADMAVMLWRMAGRPRQYGSMKYADVTDAEFTRKNDIYQSVLWITKEGIAKGYRQDDGSMIFGLNKVCNKEYVVTYMYRYDQLEKDES